MHARTASLPAEGTGRVPRGIFAARYIDGPLGPACFHGLFRICPASRSGTGYLSQLPALPITARSYRCGTPNELVGHEAASAAQPGSRSEIYHTLSKKCCQIALIPVTRE